MAFVQASGAFVPLDITNGGSKASPTAGIFGKLRVRRLEEDFYTVEGSHNSFGLDLGSARNQYTTASARFELCMHLPHSPLTLQRDRFARYNRHCASSQPRRLFVSQPRHSM